MSYYSKHFQTIDVKVEGVQITAKNVTFYPSVSATEVDPPDGAFVEYEALFIGDVDVTELVASMSGRLHETIDEKIIQQIEG